MYYDGIMEKFAKWLEDNRYSLALFGRHLAERMGLEKPFSYQTVSNWRNGTNKPHIDTAFAIEDFTNGGVPIEAWRK